MNEEINNNMEETKGILNKVNNNDSRLFSQWTKEKADLRYNADIPTFDIYNNFIYWCNLGINIGSEQDKLRPVLIVKSLKKSPICTVIPLTSKRLDDDYWYHIDLEKIDSTVLVEQIRTVSKIRITAPFRKKGNMVILSQEDWKNINAQIEKLYRLRPLKNNL